MKIGKLEVPDECSKCGVYLNHDWIGAARWIGPTYSDFVGEHRFICPTCNYKHWVKPLDYVRPALDNSYGSKDGNK